MLLTEVQGPGRAWGDTFAGLGNQVLSELYGVRNEEYDTVSHQADPDPRRSCHTDRARRTQSTIFTTK